MKPTEALNSLSSDLIRSAISRNGYDVTATGCHIFRGPKTTAGYGRVNIGRLRVQAHRASWVAENGPMPSGKDACHRCDTRDCINPEHIFPGTRRENMLDASEKRRLHAHVSPETMPRGNRHGQSKLDSLQVQEIRSVYIRGCREFGSKPLARRFGVDQATIRRIVKGVNWRAIRALQQKEREA